MTLHSSVSTSPRLRRPARTSAPSPSTTAHPQSSGTTPLLTTDHLLVPGELHEYGMGTFGVVATAPIAAGTLCLLLGGYVTHERDFRQLSDYRQRHSFQVGDELFMVCGEEPSIGDFVNHSCDPTLVFVGEISLAARRDIEAGEELTFDYSTVDSAPFDEFECECETALCRRKVTGADWMRPDLQQRYAGNFAPYLQRRINALQSN